VEDYSSIANLLNHLPFDIRAEIVAADLIEQGIDPDQLIFKPVSLFKRRFSKDVSGAKIVENNDRQEIHIEVTRDGIYDTLPEGLFHQPKSKTSFRKKSDMIANVKTLRAEEENARKYFQPMENELYHVRAAIEQAERRIFFDLEHSETNELLITFWNLAEYRRYSALPILVRLMPILYRLSGNLDYIKTCYELMLRVPVSIHVVHTYNTQQTNINGWQLGHHVLGFETVCSEQLTNELPVYKLALGPLSAALIADYLPGGRLLPFLTLLNSYFLAAGYEVVLEIIPQERDCTFDLSRDTLHLGINVALH
jgi:hypothetical protein